jgi:hypothetical protein
MAGWEHGRVNEHSLFSAELSPAEERLLRKITPDEQNVKQIGCSTEVF